MDTRARTVAPVVVSGAVEQRPPPDPSTPESTSAGQSTPHAAQAPAPSPGQSAEELAVSAKPPNGPIHVVGMTPGNSVPLALLDLPYQVVVVKATELDRIRSCHTLVPHVLSRNKDAVVIVVGDRMAVEAITTGIKKLGGRDDVRHVTVDWYKPTREDNNYLFQDFQLDIISRSLLPWKVYSALQHTVTSAS